jgi:hypothetical protein
MFWWFERRGAYMRCEVLKLATEKLELRVLEPDGTESVEAFDDDAGLAARQQHFSSTPLGHGWRSKLDQPGIVESGGRGCRRMR